MRSDLRDCPSRCGCARWLSDSGRATDANFCLDFAKRLPDNLAWQNGNNCWRPNVPDVLLGCTGRADPRVETALTAALGNPNIRCSKCLTRGEVKFRSKIVQASTKCDTYEVSAFVYGAEDDVTACTKEFTQLQEVAPTSELTPRPWNGYGNSFPRLPCSVV